MAPYVGEGANAQTVGRSLRELGASIRSARQSRAKSREQAIDNERAALGLKLRQQEAEADAAKADRLDRERIVRNTFVASEMEDLGEMEKAIGSRASARRIMESMQPRVIQGLPFPVADPKVVEEEASKRAAIEGRVRRMAETAKLFDDPQEAYAWLQDERKRIEALVLEEENRSYSDGLQDRIRRGGFNFYGETEMSPEIQDRLEALTQAVETGQLDPKESYALEKAILDTVVDENQRRIKHEAYDQRFSTEIGKMDIFSPQFNEMVNARALWMAGIMSDKDAADFFVQQTTGQKTARSSQTEHKRKLRSDAVDLAKQNPRFPLMKEHEVQAEIDKWERLLDVPQTKEAWELESEANETRLNELSERLSNYMPPEPDLRTPKAKARATESRKSFSSLSKEQQDSFGKEISELWASGASREEFMELVRKYGVSFESTRSHWGKWRKKKSEGESIIPQMMKPRIPRLPFFPG